MLAQHVMHLFWTMTTKKKKKKRKRRRRRRRRRKKEEEERGWPTDPDDPRWDEIDPEGLVPWRWSRVPCRCCVPETLPEDSWWPCDFKDASPAKKPKIDDQNI